MLAVLIIRMVGIGFGMATVVWEVDGWQLDCSGCQHGTASRGHQGYEVGGGWMGRVVAAVVNEDSQIFGLCLKMVLAISWLHILYESDSPSHVAESDKQR